MHRAPLIEVFHSLQGEGRFVGTPMVFLRVATCPIRCLYCDTPHSYTASADFPARSGEVEQREPNPVTAARAAELVRLVYAASPLGGPPIVSVTGGEPLVFPGFVHDLGALLRRDGWRLHLESAALDPDAVRVCAAQVDHLSADYKLPETLADGQDHGERHVRCVELALLHGATADVKIVITPAVTLESFQRALQVLRPVRSAVQLVVQPVTPFGAVREGVGREALERFAGAATHAGFDVRVLPQVHRVLGVP